MKYLLVLLVVLAGAWLLLGRRRGERPPAAPPQKRQPTGSKPQAMLTCAHCGVHLPEDDVLRDAAGRAFCTEAHRLAGPR